MEMKENLLENILVIGQSEDTNLFDDIEHQEAKMAENADLYDVFYKIKKVLESPSKYNEIQSVAPAIDVNKGLISIQGVCKHNVKAQSSDLNQVDDATTSTDYSTSIIDQYAGDLGTIVPKGLNINHEVLDDDLPGMDKTRFCILITRKG